MASRSYDIITVGGGIAASHWPEPWPSEALRSLYWSGKSNLKIVCAERLLCLGVWPKRMNSEFAAC